MENIFGRGQGWKKSIKFLEVDKDGKQKRLKNINEDKKIFYKY